MSFCRLERTNKMFSGLMMTVALDGRGWHVQTFIIYTLIVGTLVVFGIIGNSLAFAVFWKGNFKSSTTFLFMSLALTDSVVLLTAFMIYSIKSVSTYMSGKTFFPSYTIIGLHIFAAVLYVVSHTIHHVDDSTDRCQPLYHRVSSVKGVRVVHQFQGEETGGCSACLSYSIQHRNLWWNGGASSRNPNRAAIHLHTGCYMYTHSANMHPRVTEHSADTSVEHSSSYADPEPEYPEG